MGYTTDFKGQITIEPPLSQREIDYLTKFSETRRMKRKNGPYFVGGSGSYGQGRDADILAYNDPPEGQPGLWCQWVPTEDGSALEWNGTEKFYAGAEWMRYLIDHFLKPGAVTGIDFCDDHVCNGVIEAQGEDPSDRWDLVVRDNKVTVRNYKMVVSEEEDP